MKSSRALLNCGGWCFGALAVVVILGVSAVPVLAQNFNSDAREIGMGGSDQSNAATSLVKEQKSYRTIPLPFGLIQVLKHRDAFDPGDTVNFNPLLLIEDMASPLHITFGRDSETEGSQIVKDLVNGKVSRNLLDYRGFVPKSPLSSQGLFAPSFGKTIRLLKVGEFFQGFYVGAGPYLHAGTSVAFDQALLDAWSGASSAVPANSSLHLDNVTSGQAAAAITVGYRARFEGPQGLQSNNGEDRDGVYVALDYHYLRGYHYDADTINARFDTDSTGQIALAIPTAPPVAVDRIWSKSGTGRAVDFGTTIVTGHWDFNFGANGIGNQITWDSLVHQKFELSYLLGSLDFVKTGLPAPPGSLTIKLPVQYSAGTAVHTRKWTLQGQGSRRLNGKEYHGGGEYHLGPIDLRAGGRYAKKIFNPMGGLGLNIGKHFGIDSAVYTTTSNAQQDRRVSMAFSLRLQ